MREHIYEYLQNFWNPQVGHTVKQSENNTYTVSRIDDQYPEQVEFEQVPDKVFFIQDFEWEPRFEDLDWILEKIGLTKLKDGWQYEEMFFKQPDCLEDYAKTLKTFRAFSAAFHGKERLISFLDD